jgi:hypothetical protein
MNIREWAQRGLVETGAAFVCEEHGFIVATTNIPAVRRSVSFARVNPLPDLSPDEAELSTLEEYLSLPDTCSGCNRGEGDSDGPHLGDIGHPARARSNRLTDA